MIWRLVAVDSDEEMMIYSVWIDFTKPIYRAFKEHEFPSGFRLKMV